MARIRIIDEWLRSPVSPPSRHRAVMVVAESWSEQRVLMRAYAACADQTRPTIVLHGAELAIGPAGLEAHGEWGIHVEPPVDGRAQELRTELELAARRLAGSKGNPPRLSDEASRFDSKATNLWAPGTPPDRPPAPGAPPPGFGFGYGYYELVEAAAQSSWPVLVAGNAAPTLAPAPASPGAAVGSRTQRGFAPADPAPARAGASAPVAGAPVATFPRSAAAASAAVATLHPSAAPMPALASVLPVSPVPPSPPSAPLSPLPVPGVPAGAGARLSFATLAGRTLPLGLQLSPPEREVLNALGAAACLTADQIGHVVGASDPVLWMERFMAKLASLGLDLVAQGTGRHGERTYALRR